MEAAEALFFAHPFWAWTALAGVFLIGELITTSGWLLWPAGSAVVVALATGVLSLGWPREVILFVVISVVFTYLGRRFLRPTAKLSDDINDPTPRLVGKRGEATGAFADGRGRVFVDGKEWSAELEAGGALVAHAKVEVVEVVGGARLKVRPI